MKSVFIGSCPNLPGHFVMAIQDNSKDITMETLKRNIGNKTFQKFVKNLGYSRSMPIKKDYHVSYFKSKYKNRQYYGVNWSSMEFIWKVEK